MDWMLLILLQQQKKCWQENKNITSYTKPFQLKRLFVLSCSILFRHKQDYCALKIETLLRNTQRPRLRTRPAVRRLLRSLGKTLPGRKGMPGFFVYILCLYIKLIDLKKNISHNSKLIISL